MSDSEKSVKPKRVMSEAQKEKLALARAKANEIRKQKKEERLLEKEVNDLEKKEKVANLKQRKAKLTKSKIAPEPEEDEEVEEQSLVDVYDGKEHIEEVVYQKVPKQKLPSHKPKPKKKKKIVYYDESSSEEEAEIVYKKRPKAKQIKEEVKAEIQEPQVPQFYRGNYLSDEMIKRQYNKELEEARVSEMLKYMKPQSNWTR
jgi:hypothetical protein